MMEVGGHGHRKIGRPKLGWSDAIIKGMKEKGVGHKEGAQDRRTLRLKTRSADPK